MVQRTIMHDARSTTGLAVAFAVALVGLTWVGTSRANPPESPRSATVPITLDHNRMFVEVEFDRPDGTVRKARAWVDTGSERLALAEPLARDLGFEIPPYASRYETEYRSVDLDAPAPPMRLGGLPLRVEGVRTQAHSTDVFLPGLPAEVNLPAVVLRHDHVVFDYPARQLTVARPGALEPKGIAIPCRVNAQTGLFLIEAVLDGEPAALGIDNGSAGTWVSNALTTKWKKHHPEWPQAIGAAGSANFFGFSFESEGVLTRLPEIGIGALRARNVALLGIEPGLVQWYSEKSAGPVVGFLGANVLRGFRIEIDYPNRMTYWEAGPSSESRDLDIVGVTLHPRTDGSYSIACVVTKDGNPCVEGVQAGDTLLRVGDLDTRNATMGAVVDALRGTPGSARPLLVERDGKRITIDARVMRLP